MELLIFRYYWVFLFKLSCLYGIYGFVKKMLCVKRCPSVAYASVT